MARPSLRLYTDGGSRGNPGPAAIGGVVCNAEDRVIREFKEFIGTATNNEAEYRALAKGLVVATSYGREGIECVLDSELLVRQLTGEYAIREPRLAAIASDVRALAHRFHTVRFHHLPRNTGHLRRADALVNEALDEAGF